jgi:hypothetical protein
MELMKAKGNNSIQYPIRRMNDAIPAHIMNDAIINAVASAYKPQDFLIPFRKYFVKPKEH